MPWLSLMIYNPLPLFGTRYLLKRGGMNYGADIFGECISRAFSEVVRERLAGRL